jgi:hypothetical protein
MIRAADRIERYRVGTAAPRDPGANGAGVSAIEAALRSSRVDLLERVRDGLPPREFIPGMGGALVRGKRHHIHGPAKTGKTETIAVVGGLDIAAAGCTVVVLDRENGADEYARRVAAVLDARGADAHAREVVREHYHYYAWPQLRLEMGKDDAYAHAFQDAAVVIFDSSRKFLTSVGLKEDAADDYSAFTEALLDPLMHNGIATVVLDNTGHGDRARARGTSAKADLADVVFSLTAKAAFSIERAGRVELNRK